MGLAVAIPFATMLPAGEATTGGSAYAVPEVVDTNPDPNIVETTLVAEEATVRIGPFLQTAKALTYNGTIPGPTFRLKVGDTVIVHYENKLDKPSAIHWHGIELANAMDGTPLTQQQSPPNGKFLYRFKVERPGIFWYHPHHHSSTNQVFKGLYGMILVEDPNDAALRASGTLPPLSQTKQLVLSDITVCKADGANPAHTYDDNDDATPATTQPWAKGAAVNPPLPHQANTNPKTLCEAPTAIDDEGALRPSYAEGDVPNIQRAAHFGQTNEGQTVLTNGMDVGSRLGGPGPPPVGATPPGALGFFNEQLDVQSGQGLRLQILNAAAIRYMRLRLSTAAGTLVPLRRIGGEGGLLDNAVTEGGVIAGFDTEYNLGEILLPPGSRADVVAAIPAGLPLNSVLTLWTEDYSRTGGGATGESNIATVPVMHLKVTGNAAAPFLMPDGKALRAATGDPVPLLGAATGVLLTPAGFTPAKLGLPNQDIKLQRVANTELQVDGVRGEHDFPGSYMDAGHSGSTRYAKQGDTLQLSVTNQTGANHPFHLHGFSIQPISLTPAPVYNWPYQEFRDNVDVPAGKTLTFKIKLNPRNLSDGVTPGGALGRWVFHCHIFFHATAGMISELVIADGPAGDAGNERPNVNVDNVAVEANQGQPATVTGTFKDTDGDAVTLTSSVGTVTKTGGLNWKWDFPTGTSNSQFVFVTATDSNGLKSQIPFFLKVTNTGPPTLAVPGAQNLTVGDAVDLKVTAADPDAADVLALTGSGLPAGLTFKDNGDRTGTISGSPTTAGSSTASFAVADGHNPSVGGTVAFTVAPKPPVAASTLRAIVTKPEVLVKRAVTVGCRFSTKSIRRCTASIFRGRTRIGRATRTLTKSGATTMNVSVALPLATRRVIARSIGGVAIEVRLSALKFGSTAASSATAKTSVVPQRIVSRATFSAFARGGAVPNARGRTFLTSLAKRVKRAKTIVCTGHPDSGLSRARSRSLAKRRAAAACAALRKAGLKAKFTSSAALRPRSRRFEITINR